jgi:hypothetical protein
MQSPAARKTRSILANAAKTHGSDSIESQEAKRAHRVQVLADHIAAVVASAPPITDDQRSILRALLGGA